MSMYKRVPYLDRQQFERRAIDHLAGCIVARIHGKSPVEYLTPPEQIRVEGLAAQLFDMGPATTLLQAYNLLEKLP